MESTRITTFIVRSFDAGANVVLVFAILLVVLLIVFWVLTILGLPGNWLSVLATGLYAWLGPAEPPFSIGWQIVALLVVLAAIGEVIEFVAGAAGASKVGGSKRGAVLAIVGGIVGAVAGLFIGLPIPVVGSLISSLLLAGLGALLGAVAGELWKGRTGKESLRIGVAAFRGRLLGTLGKVLLGFAILVIVVVALFV